MAQCARVNLIKGVMRDDVFHSSKGGAKYYKHVIPMGIYHRCAVVRPPGDHDPIENFLDKTGFYVGTWNQYTALPA